MIFCRKYIEIRNAEDMKTWYSLYDGSKKTYTRPLRCRECCIER